MRFVLSLGGLFRLALQRLRRDPLLTLSILLGWIAALTLTTSIPMYVEEANARFLGEDLGEIKSAGEKALPFMILVPPSPDELSPERFHAMDLYATTQVPPQLQMELLESTLSVLSQSMDLFPTTVKDLTSERESLGATRVGFVRGLMDHARLVEGAWPTTHATAPEAALEALVTPAMAATLGAQVGEEYIIFGQDEQLGRFQVQLRIAGIWVPTNPAERFWFLAPQTYDGVLLLAEEVYLRDVMPSAEAYALSYVAWFQAYSSRTVNTDSASTLLKRLTTVQTRLRGIIPTVDFPRSPDWALVRYQESVARGTNVLLAFCLPSIGLVLLFVILVSAMSVQRRQDEIALFRSRGMSAPQVLLLYFFQGLVLGGISLGMGLVLARYMAQLLGRARAFLTFAEPQTLLVTITRKSLQVGGLVTLLCIAFYLLPALQATQFTVVGFWQRVARWGGKAWWQRAFLDASLVIAAGYGYYLLRAQKGLGFLVGGGGDVLQQPLVLITPALFLLVGVLLFLRLAPYLLNIVAWLSSYLPGTVLLLALRHLARAANYYSGVFLLLAFSLGLSFFTASLARTLDTNLSQRAQYRVGSDLSVKEMVSIIPKSVGQMLQEAEDERIQGASAQPAPAVQDGASLKDHIVTFALIPSDQALQAPGVLGATRVYRFGAQVRLKGGSEKGTLLGLERLTFPRAAFYRADLSTSSLGELMNALASDEDALLVDRAFMAEQHLNVGDRLRLRLGDPQATQVDFQVAGEVNLFPTVYPEHQPLFVGNLEYILHGLGQPVPGEIWLRLQPTTDPQPVLDKMTEMGFLISTVTDARLLVKEEQAQWLRAGLFGLLSVSFILIIILGVLCLAIYSLLRFRQCAIQFGILHAIGLSRGQLEGVFLTEQVAIVAMTTLVGTALGLWGARLFIPFYNLSAEARLALPPLLTAVAWQDAHKAYLLLAATLPLLALGALRLLGRLCPFEAIKEGTQLVE